MARAFMKDLLPTLHRTVDDRQALLFDFVLVRFLKDLADFTIVAVAYAPARVNIICSFSPLNTNLNLIQVVILSYPLQS